MSWFLAHGLLMSKLKYDHCEGKHVDLEGGE